MNFLSVCSGIEAASVAWAPLGWKAGAFSEIEPFPCSLLAHHYPSVPNRGDMTKFQEWPDAAFDLLCGGTPCQSFSVAGLRAGLADPRGNLMLTFAAIADRYRPRWLVWENVPGVLSSAGGRDFGSFLWLLGFLGYGFAYRVLDAQHFGVPQRRRRVFVVGHLGSWQRAAAVLFERHSLQGHSAPSNKARQAVAGSLGAGSKRSGGRVGRREAAAGHVVATLDANFGRLQGASGQDANHGHSHLIPFDTTQMTSQANRSNPKPGDPCHPLAAGAHAPAIAFDCKATQASEGEISPTLRAMTHSGSHQNGGGQVAVAFSATDYKSGAFEEIDVARSLTTSADRTRGAPITFQGDTDARAYQADASSVLRTLRERLGAQAVAEWGSRVLDSLQSPEVLRAWLHGESLRRASGDLRSFVDNCPLPREEGVAAGAMRQVWEDGPDGRSPQGRGLAKQLAFELGEALSELPFLGAFDADTLHRLRQGAEGARALRQALSEIQEVGRSVGGEAKPAYPAMQVRRLTPVECERLMGFPDSYTLVPHRGKPAADGPRYKALGNSWAVPCVRWIGRRIAAVDAIEK